MTITKNKKSILAIPALLVIGMMISIGLFGLLANVAADEMQDLADAVKAKCDAELRAVCPGKLGLEANADIDYEDPYVQHVCFNALNVQECWDKYWIPKEDPEGIADECENGMCDAGEDCSNCLFDCPCNSGETCQPDDSNADAYGCVVSAIDLTVTTDKKTYSPKETVIIQGKVSDAKSGLNGATLAIEVSSTQYLATASITTNSAGNYRLEFPIPTDVTQIIYTVSATVSYSEYPSVSKSTSFVVGEIGMRLEKNIATGESFIGVVADEVSSLGIFISLPGCSEGCSDVKVNQPDIGKLEGDAIDSGGNVILDSAGVAEITYYPPDYLTKDQLTQKVDVHKSGSKVWAAEVPLTLSYKDANEQEGKIEAEILVSRPPVMLVHGFLGASATWGKMSSYLRGEKFDTYTGNYGATDQSIEGLSLILKQDIQKQKIDYANADIKLIKVDIVGHSMGGLIARHYSHGLASYEGDVKKIIMVGTPNHGVSWSKKIIGNIGAGWYQTHHIPAGQLYSESPFMETLNSGEKSGAHLNPDIQYGNIYGFPDDWVVSSASAYLNGVASVTESDVKHSPDIPGIPAVSITEYLNTWEQVKSWLTSDIWLPQLTGSSVEVYKYTGDVYLINYDSSGGHESKLMSDSAKFDSWQSLRTGQDSKAIVHLKIDDLPWGVIFLDPDSEIFLGYLSPQLVEVRLWKGSAVFRSKQDGHFTVPVNISRSKDGEWWKYSPQAVVTGRNTEFAVTAGKNIEVHCLEGELIVDTPNATEEGTILSVNNSVAVNGEKVVAIDPVSRDTFWWSTEDDDFLDSNANSESIDTNNLLMCIIFIGVVFLGTILLVIVILFKKKRISKAELPDETRE